MIVVSDTSVITNLARIDHLNLLKDLYHSIVIPTPVRDELMNHAGTMHLVQERSWIEAVAPTDKKLYEKLLITLDPGEAAAIVLSKELSADIDRLIYETGFRVGSGLYQRVLSEVDE